MRRRVKNILLDFDPNFWSSAGKRGKGGMVWCERFLKFLVSSTIRGAKLRELVLRHYIGSPDFSLRRWSGYKSHQKFKEKNPQLWNHPVMATVKVKNKS